MRKLFANEAAYQAHKRALSWALVIALAVGVIILWRFVTVIAVAAIAAYIFQPVFLWLERVLKRTGAAASLTLLASFVAVLLPAMVVILVTVSQLQTFIRDIDQAISSNASLFDPGTQLNRLNEALDDISGGRLEVSVEQVQEYGLQALSAIGEFFLNGLKGSVGSLTAIITNIIIYIYVFTALLIHRKQLIRVAKQLNPLGDEIADLYLQRAGAMTKGMVRGQFIIATAQGIAGAAFLYLAGLHYFAFFALLLTAVSIIPLGGGIVSIPIGVIMLLTGNVGGGLLVLLSHFFIITNIDNVLRPHLVPATARLNSALTIIAVLSGVGLFGFLGIVIGPVLMILVVSTIEVYIAFTNQKHKGTA